MKDFGLGAEVAVAVSLSRLLLPKKEVCEFGDVGELKNKDETDVGEVGEVEFACGWAASLVTGAPVWWEMKIGRPRVSLEKSAAVEFILLVVVDVRRDSTVLRCVFDRRLKDGSGTDVGTLEEVK